MTSMTLGFALFIVAMAVSMDMSRRGLLALSPEEKVRFVDGSLGLRQWYAWLFVLGWLLASFAADKLFPTHGRAVFLADMGGLIVFGVVLTVMAQRRIVRLALPAESLRWFRIAGIVQLAGVLVLVLSQVWQFWSLENDLLNGA